MRDFNSGDIKVDGNFNVIDNSHNEHKLLVQRFNEGLLLERPFRQENIWLEQQRKIQRLIPLYGFSLVIFIAAAIMAIVSFPVK